MGTLNLYNKIILFSVISNIYMVIIKEESKRNTSEGLS